MRGEPFIKWIKCVSLHRHWIYLDLSTVCHVCHYSAPVPQFLRTSLSSKATSWGVWLRTVKRLGNKDDLGGAIDVWMVACHSSNATNDHQRLTLSNGYHASYIYIFIYLFIYLIIYSRNGHNMLIWRCNVRGFVLKITASATVRNSCNLLALFQWVYLKMGDPQIQCQNHKSHLVMTNIAMV